MKKLYLAIKAAKRRAEAKKRSRPKKHQQIRYAKGSKIPGFKSE